MKKKKKKKVKKELGNNTNIKGFSLLCFGLLSMLSVFSVPLGIFGNFIKEAFIFLMGLGAYFLPFFIIIIGLCHFVKKGKISLSKKFYGIILFIINLLLFIQMANMKKFYIDEDFFEGILNLYNTKTIFHGGLISYIIDIPLLKLLGYTGSYIIFTFMFITSMFMIFNISVDNILTEIIKKKKQLQHKRQLYKQQQESEALIAYDTMLEDNKSLLNKDSSSNKEKKVKIIDFLKSKQTTDNQFNKNKSNKDLLINDSNNKKEKDYNVPEVFQKEIEENSVENIVYQFPELDLLNKNNTTNLNKEDKRGLLDKAEKLEETLNSFGVDAKVLQVTKGPSVTRFELQPNSGVKVSKIVNLADDIALNLAAPAVRIEAPIPGKAAVGIEVPNSQLTPVYLRDVIQSLEFNNTKDTISFALGKDIAGNCVVTDLTKMPHLLIAGATGSGKSVCINTIILSILYKYSPENVKLLMIDPKVVELNIYNGIPHLLIPVVTDPKKAAGALNWAVNEMTKRYKLFAENNVRNIDGYNEMLNKGILNYKLPYIVIIIDELSDLMMVAPNDVEDYIGRLAQMARAAGMYIVIATQRPSVDVITGVIKANIPSRISFAVSSQIDSRTILDCTGAEKLLGKGDMLFYPVGESKPLRIQGAFISEEEVERVVEFIKDEKGEAQYRTEIIDEINTSVSQNANNDDCDELFDMAVEIAKNAGQVSTSLLQRKLRIGYNRAARIIEQMEDQCIISSKDGSKPRKFLRDINETEDQNI